MNETERDRESTKGTRTERESEMERESEREGRGSLSSTMPGHPHRQKGQHTTRSQEDNRDVVVFPTCPKGGGVDRDSSA